MLADGTATTVDAQVAREAEARDLLTLGIEEEYLLVDATAPHAVPLVEDVFAHLPDGLRDSVQHEYLVSQIEVASPPGLDLGELRRSLGRLRTEVAAAARRAGARLVAVGASPARGRPSPVVDDPRYHAMVRRYGDLSPGGGLNGMHVHIGIPDPETGVQILNHLRPWLPLLQAVTTNSPCFDGRDTGYASWRSVMWERWPTVGPTPYLESHAHYEELLGDLIAGGAMLDQGMLYWYARLSARYPTVEVRVGDVCPTVEDAALVAALVRGLVATVLRDIRDGRPAPRVQPELLSAAHWRAAHDGLDGLAVDLGTRRPRPAWELVRRLVDTVRPELERHGDLDTVTVLLGRLRAHGTGATRQRAAYAGRRRIGDVVDWLADRTAAS
jgi:glutamate---cysteine ligase / carboxylate-amine ligase